MYACLCLSATGLTFDLACLHREVMVNAMLQPAKMRGHGTQCGVLNAASPLAFLGDYFLCFTFSHAQM